MPTINREDYTFYHKRLPFPPPGDLLAPNLTVSSILFQSGNTLRVSFSGTPDLSSLAVSGNLLIIKGATFPGFNGLHIHTAVNDGSDYIEFEHPSITDASQDVASASGISAWVIDHTTVQTYAVGATGFFPAALESNNNERKTIMRMEFANKHNEDVRIYGYIVPDGDYPKPEYDMGFSGKKLLGQTIDEIDSIGINPLYTMLDKYIYMFADTDNVVSCEISGMLRNQTA